MHALDTVKAVTPTGRWLPRNVSPLGDTGCICAGAEAAVMWGAATIRRIAMRASIPDDQAPDHFLVRARRGLELVLHRRHPGVPAMTAERSRSGHSRYAGLSSAAQGADVSAADLRADRQAGGARNSPPHRPGRDIGAARRSQSSHARGSVGQHRGGAAGIERRGVGRGAYGGQLHGRDEHAAGHRQPGAVARPRRRARYW